ncbi:YecA family protein [Motiliproteus sp. SC1-56]|uniref:YecA/YgfB family protein n=1 Tax=Motiliproteus sp. SC1-56 TaxID=2799565 RepID=UPI001A8ED147|nr:YecA family protein [Motiliproteus sp. SC1-56]
MHSPDSRPLDEAEIDLLEAFLFSPAVSGDALDYPGLHGLLTALAVSPVPVPETEWLEVLFDGQPGYADEQEKARIEGLLRRELAAIAHELDQEEAPELPCDLTLDEEEPLLTNWAQGFMEGVFLREEAWFSQDEERVAELLLPIMVASELFDEPELTQIRNDARLCESLCEEIPELLTDLYLHFRVPEEPKAPKGRNGARRR